MATVRISQETLVKAMQSDQTRAALKAKADQLASQVQSRVTASHAKLAVGREDGTRPKGRPYSRVQLTSADEEKPVPAFVKLRILDAATGQVGGDD